MTIQTPSPVYLDYAATTPVDPRVVQEMLPYFSQHFGNPANTSHVFGQQAAKAVAQARLQVANLLDSPPTGDVVFTSGATESNNLVFKGLSCCPKQGKHVLTVATEHKSVLVSAKALEAHGFEVTILGVKPNGLIDLNAFESALRPDTRLVSVMLVNNEIGTIQPLAEISQICQQRQILLHCDAVQGAGKIPFSVKQIPIDFVSLSAHKLYGPKGIGALYIRHREPYPLSACIEGGGQEFGLRSGTLNVPGIVAFGKAAELAREELTEEVEKLTILRQRLYHGIVSELSDVHLSGSLNQRAPGNLHLCFGGVPRGSLVKSLKNLAVSAGSACSSASGKPSYVLSALGLPDELALNAVRFSLGRFTTPDEIEMAIETVVAAVKELRLGKKTALPF